MNYRGQNKGYKYFIYARKSSESEDRQIQSIDDQVNRLKKMVQDMDLQVVKVFTEAKSAKTPGNRPIFSDIINRIQRGEANGILCWQLNRLTRNPIDSGTLSWLLQQGILKSIQTIDREYLPDDNVILFNVDAGSANQFIIDLRKNTVRGLQTKLDKGWAPIIAPIGYINDLMTKTIAPDPNRFALIRKMWDLMLMGGNTAERIVNIANNEWGLRTIQRKREGGKPLSHSGVYRMFHNPFYYGAIHYDNRVFTGAHIPMVTKEEFDRVKAILGKIDKTRKRTHDFAFTAIIRCGYCNCLVTADEKDSQIKSTGKMANYTYYHCTKKSPNLRCKEPSVTLKNLERQIVAEISKYTIHPEFRAWALDVLREKHQSEVDTRSKIYDSLNDSFVQIQTQLDNLTGLRLRDLITDDEFVAKRKKMQEDMSNAKDQISRVQSRAESWLDTVDKALCFATVALEKFEAGDTKTKREILTAIGQQFTLKDGRLSIEPSEGLQCISNQQKNTFTAFSWLEKPKFGSVNQYASALAPENPGGGGQRELNP